MTLAFNKSSIFTLSYIGMKPKMKNHFRAHQLSIWLRLIPGEVDFKFNLFSLKNTFSTQQKSINWALGWKMCWLVITCSKITMI